MRLAVSAETILAEMEGAVTLLNHWRGEVAKGVPGVDGIPATPQQRAEWVKQLCGELQVVANKCQSLAVILAADGDAL